MSAKLEEIILDLNRRITELESTRQKSYSSPFELNSVAHGKNTARRINVNDQHYIDADGTANLKSVSLDDGYEHDIVGLEHTASGLTAGHFFKATGVNAFGFVPHGLTYADVGAAAVGHSHTDVYEPVIDRGTTLQYFRGDLSLATMPTSLPNPHTLTLGAGLTGTSYNGSAAVTAAVSYGSSAGTACQGDDIRLSDARVPLAHDHNSLYPSLFSVFGSLNQGSIPYYNGNLFSNSLLAQSTNTVTIGTQAATQTPSPTRFVFDGSYADEQVSTKCQIDLHAGSVGLGVTSYTLNYYSVRYHDFFSNGVKVCAINDKGVNLGGGSDPSENQGDNWLTWGRRTADALPYYCIRSNYKQYGATTYSRLQIAWLTGIEIGASSLYGGTRFYDNPPGITGATQIMSIGDGDNSVRISANAYAVGEFISNYACRASMDAGDGTGTYIGVFKNQGSLPGHPSNYWPTLKTDFTWLYFAANDLHVAHLGGTSSQKAFCISSSYDGATSTATPDYIDTGLSFSDTPSDTKCKLYVYRNPGTAQYYGFGVGASGDVQYHSHYYHDFYINNVLKTRISSDSIDLYNNLVMVGGTYSRLRGVAADIGPQMLFAVYGCGNVTTINTDSYLGSHFVIDSGNGGDIALLTGTIGKVAFIRNISGNALNVREYPEAGTYVFNLANNQMVMCVCYEIVNGHSHWNIFQSIVTH